MRATKRRVVLWLLLIPLALATSSAAQSFLGSIRGTVVDPQGAAVKGAAVLIRDVGSLHVAFYHKFVRWRAGACRNYYKTCYKGTGC